MKKKLLALVLVVVLAVTSVVSGTMAYLTSEDNDVNVMTLGNVSIEQHEYERAVDADGNYETVRAVNRGEDGYKLTAFTQAKPLYPATGAVTGWDPMGVCFEQLDGNKLGKMTVLAGLNNVQDKFVFVENTGKSDAYVRTLVAYEVGSVTDAYGTLIMTNVNVFWKANDVGVVSINGNNYYVVEYVYDGNQYPEGGTMIANGNGKHPDGIVHPGEYTYCSLGQVYMVNEATNEDVAAIDGNGNGLYDILVLSQAVQTTGFAGAETALDTAFGDATADTVPGWFGEAPAPVIVNTVEELQAAVDAATNGATIILGSDITGNVTVTQKKDVVFVIDGSGHTFNGVMTVFGNGRKATAGLTIKNVDFIAASGASSCIVSPDRTVNNAYSYSSNVTVENCTFTDPDGTVNCAAVRHEDGGDSNWKIIDCVVDSTMHSMIQTNNVERDGLLIQGCTIKSKNGINLNQCAKVSIVDCEIDVKGYAVRYGVNGATVNGTFAITDCTLKSANDDGDAVIIFRGTMTGSTLTITNSTLDGNPEISGNANVIR